MKALQLHSTVPGLWIYAAVWEAEQNSNVTAARALMQQGLRMCPKSETLWLEYFHMELIFAQKIKARRLILGVEEKPAIAEGGSAQEGAVSDQGEEVDGKIKRKSSISHHAATCKIAWAVYKNAIAAIPNSLSFRQRFLEIVETIDVEQSEALEDEIYAGLRQDFDTDEESWAWLAKRHLVKAEMKGLGMLEARLEASKV
jgi:U3 small nucleolar RNA-associated protein 6